MKPCIICKQPCKQKYEGYSWCGKPECARRIETEFQPDRYDGRGTYDDRYLVISHGEHKYLEPR